MARSLLLLLAGAVLGGLGVYLVGNEIARQDSLTLESATAIASAQDPSAGAPLSEIGGATGARMDVYRRALEATDVLDLETMIQIAAAAPRSRSRNLEIEVLMARLAEIDPSRAVGFARSGSLETRFLLQAFVALARKDTDKALDELAGLTPPARQRQVALALLDVVGSDESGTARIASLLPEQDRSSFTMDALIARAETDPIAAIDAALEYDSLSSQSLLPRLAEVAARHDAIAALALSETIDEEGLRRVFQNALLSAWADADPEAMFAWLLQAPMAQLTTVAAAFQALANSDADRLLTIADALPLRIRTSARQAVMQTYAERDPVAALALLDTMPIGQDRETLLQAIARTYGRQNPDLALAWVETLPSVPPSVMQSLIQGIAAVDVNRAIDVFVASLDAPEATPFVGAAPIQTVLPSFTTMMSMLTADGADIGRLADELLATPSPSVRSMLSSALSTWAARDSAGALSWTVANADRLDAAMLPSIARQLADTDLNLAIMTLDRLLPEQRGGWLEGIVMQMARADVDGAMSFVDRYRGQPGYDGALGRVVQEMARSDPARAARMLAETPRTNSSGNAAFMIAREWASRDPAAAARWAAEDLAESTMQTAALSTIASTWVQRDAAAAERWMFGLQPGPNRDAAASGLMTAAAQVGRFEPRLLEAYSSEAAGQQGASQAIIMIGRSDPNRAAALMDAYLTDPSIRTQTEEQLARLSAALSGSRVPGAAIIF